MPATPPYQCGDEQETEQRYPGWRDLDWTYKLDIEGHEIWVFMEGETIDQQDGHHYTPPQFGDINPNKRQEPDPEIWPLKYDPGAPADVEDLVRVMGPFPVPYVAWVTPEYLEATYGYDPRYAHIHIEDLPPSARRDKYRLEGPNLRLKATGSSSMTLTEERIEALRRIARLWNGEVVKGHHLLLDKCPRWDDILDDLDPEELRRLWCDPSIDPALVKAFGDCDWFEKDADIFLKPTRVLRRKIKWAPTLRAKTLINGRDELPSLRGDPREHLPHRIAVGLTALHNALKNHKVETYAEVGDYIVDLLVHRNQGHPVFLEVITDHQNWELHRATYRKLAELQQYGTPGVVFDSRSTAYKVINHWQRAGFGELPTGIFDSEPRIKWGREKCQEAYADPNTDWKVADWVTTQWLWQETLGQNKDTIDNDFVTSLGW